MTEKTTRSSDDQQRNESFNETFYDGTGVLRRSGEAFYDGTAVLRQPGETFYDSTGVLRAPGEEFYDGVGFLRPGQEPEPATGVSREEGTG